MNDGSSVAQLVAALRDELSRYSEGEKLPSSRALVARHRVSPVTVSRAIAALTSEGLVTARPGAGVFKAPAGRTGRPARTFDDLSWQDEALAVGPPHAGTGPRAADAAGVLATLSAPPPEVA
ncbi:winged helix-turn-helix domain-containing protein, partial [Streptomyces synnematoformans]|uniref:winged helix-turn-helix domain-containing protein n=1 Tax=Streptomyces synnematoformans TaxID=415721 RepID=UPI0031E2B95C